jgi:hypothetical protein
VFITTVPITNLCVCLLLQDLVQSCLRGGGGDMGGHVLRETTSRDLCGLGCPSRTSVCVYYCSTYGTREEPGTLIQGAPVFPGSSRWGIEPKTPGWLVQDPTTSPSGDLIPTIRVCSLLQDLVQSCLHGGGIWEDTTRDDGPRPVLGCV